MRRGVRLKYLNPKGKWPSGHVRYYYRRNDQSIPLPDCDPSDPDFLKAYAGIAEQFGPSRYHGVIHPSGSIAAGLRAFMASDHFLTRAASTREVWRRIIEKIEADYPTSLLVDLRSRHIRKDLAKFDPHPANNRLKVWRAYCKWAVSVGLIDADPARDVTMRPTPKTQGHEAWTREDAEAFRERWAIGTPQRLAFEVLHWTGARRSDAVRLNGFMLSDGWLRFRQLKTDEPVEIPMPEIAPSWAEPTDDLAEAFIGPRYMNWIVTHTGQPRSAKAFGAWFGKAAKAAGVSKTAHGVRKLRSVILRENGASLDQRKAWLGHESDQESQDYAKSADLRRIISGTEVPTGLKQVPTLRKKQ